MVTPFEEDEWEYELDYENTEVVYVTVDFSTHAPPGLSSKRTAESLHISDTRKSQSMNARKPRKRKRQPNDAQDAESVDAPTPESSTATPLSNSRNVTPAELAPPPDATAVPSTTTPAKQPEPDPTPPRPKTIQILDLDTKNPLITYDSQFYTCHWATDLGTSLYLSPPPTEALSHAPLRSFPTFDILAKTRTRLVAAPASLKPALPAPELSNPQGFNPFHDPSDPDSRDFAIDTTEGDKIFLSNKGEIKIHTPADASDAKKAQARFLERWGELKAKKGWGDPIPIKAMRSYRVPEGWEEERKRWLELEKGQKGEGAERGKSRRRQGDKFLGDVEEVEADGVESEEAQREEQLIVVPDDAVGEDDEDDDDDDDDENDEDMEVEGQAGGEEAVQPANVHSHHGASYEASQAVPGSGVLRF
ncbi:hypothetical protein BDZ85DRAFT_315352 [Elsinoe ampelina]|uniref:Transcription factor TFIIIC triple barrel domain-containing protein n=1 Tax=Elsinoe ampelina TaxID=302913 RepID=A0A6A6GQ04_9PEZI|nr:hypothetical protein BDZ85DRAFT_315352 [Elsinoe ampelina]